MSEKEAFLKALLFAALPFIGVAIPQIVWLLIFGEPMDQRML